MTTRKYRNLAAWLIAGAAMLFSIPLILWAYSSNPPLGTTGAPGSPDKGHTCAQCHNGGSGGGKISVISSSRTTYHPGTKQHLTITVADPNAKAWGYEITAVQAKAPLYTGAGTFKATDTNSGVAKSGSRSYAFQKNDQLGKTGSVTYKVDWTPPTKNVGNITLYLAGVGDTDSFPPNSSSVYTSSLTLTPH